MQLLTAVKPQPYQVKVQSDVITRFPLIGIAAITACTFLAVQLIPPDIESSDALIIPALVMSIGLAAAPMAAVFRNPRSILLGEHLLVLGPIYWLLLDLLQGVYPMTGVGPEEASYGFIAIGVFAAAVWLAALHRPWDVPEGITKAVSLNFSAQTYFAIAIISFLIAMLKFAIPCNFNVFEMVSYLGHTRWDVPWGRGQLGGWDAFLDHFEYFGYLLPILTVIVARRSSWFQVQTVLCGILSIIMLAFIAQSGSRRTVGVVCGMALILWVLSEERLRVKQVIIAPLLVVGLLLFMQLILEYRMVGVDELSERSRQGEVFESNHLHVDDNFYRLCQIIHFIPEEHPYVYEKYFIWVLIRPIPRVFWPGKPVDPGFDLPTALGIEGLSVSSSVIGELYMSLGLLGVAFGGWLYGRLAGMASRLLVMGRSFGSIVVYSIMMMALFNGLRSGLELILTSYIALAWIGLSRLFINLQGHRNSLH